MPIEIVKRIFLGSVLRLGLTLALSLIVVAGGAFAAGVIGVPALESVDNEFGEVTDEHTEIHTALTVANPNPIGLRSAEIAADYTVSMNGLEMARGGGDEIVLEPGTSTERFTTRMDNEKIPGWWATHLENGERTDVVVDATVSSGLLDRSTDVTTERTIETDLLSSFDSDETRPIEANSPVVSDPVLYVNATRAEWGAVDDRHTELDLRFDMYNPKSYDVPVTRLGYTITMNDVVVGEGETTREHLLRSKRVTTVETTTRIDNPRLDDWWVTHLQNDEVTDLRIEFDARIEVLGVTVSLPLDALTYEETIETDILGSKDATDDSASPESEERDDSTAEDESEPENGTASGSDSESDSNSGSSSDADTDTDTDSADDSSDADADETEGDAGTADENDDEERDDDGILPGLPLSS